MPQESVGEKKSGGGRLGGTASEEFVGQVPDADATENSTIMDVVGNKEDAAVSTPSSTASIVAMIKGILSGGTGPGDVYYVSTSGSDANPGTEQLPFLTIDYAVGQCTADNNDTIIVLPGTYDENAAAAGVTVDVAGITIMGLGDPESDRTIVLNSHASASTVFNVTAQNCKLINIRVEEASTGVEGMKLSSATGTVIKYCTFEGTMENGITLSSSDQVWVEGCSFHDMTNDGIELSGTTTGATIKGNHFENITDFAINLNGNGVDSNLIMGNVINGYSSATTTGIQIVLGDNNIIVNNYVAECATPWTDTGSNNAWVGNQRDSQITYTNGLQDDLKEIFDAIGGSTSDVGDVFYVSSVGSDSNPGTKGAPFLTIDYAVGQCRANNNDVIIVLPGTYDENTQAQGVLVDVAGLTIIGSGTWNTLVANSNAGAASVFTVNAHNTKIMNIQIQEASAIQGVHTSFSNGTFYNIYFNGSGGGSLLAYKSTGNENNRVQKCLFVDCDVAVDLQGIEETIEDNIFINCSGSAITTSAAADRNTIRGNVINGVAGTTTNGISMAGDNNTISANHVAGCVNAYVNTGAGNIFSDNYEGSQISAGNTIEQDLADIYAAAGGAQSSTQSATSCADANETTLFEITGKTAPCRIEAVFIDLTNWTADGNIVAGDTMTLKVYVKVDGSNYREMGNLRDVWTDSTSVGDGIKLEIGKFQEDMKVTFQSSRAPSAGVDIEYHYTQEG